jgi:serine/threonine-protein kinase
VDTLDARELTGRLVDGRYLVERRIARGGMATVYVAQDTRLERRVALKVMHPHLAENPDFVSRFVGEARAAARLSHPNVVAVHDQGTDGDDVFLVMELVDGSTLRDLLNARGRLTPAEALDVLEPVLAALGAAHRAGLVHRDVKPENVLITPEGQVTVADFGLARATSTVTNATQGVLIGTVAYLSPEQVERGVADVRSDVYGAGVLLFEMLTGRPPFEGESPIAVAYRHVHENVPAPSTVVPSLPTGLDALVAGATARDPELRYRDGDGFLSAVRATRDRLGLEPVSGAPFAPAPPTNHDTLIVSSDLTADPGPGAARATGVLDVPVVQPDDNPTDRSLLPLGGAGRTRRRRWRGPVALLAVLALVIGVGYGAWALGTTPSTVVPGVLGKTESQANALLAEAGLFANTGSAVFSETVKAGRVVRVTPEPGSQIDRESTVTLTLSKGPERYAVPNVVGQTASDARKAITGTKLEVGDTKEAFSSSVAKGVVISTDPKAGAKLKKETPVDLVVSKGPEPIPVPSVKGQTVTAAQSALSARGLTFAVTEKFSETVAKGRVISQSPASGTLPPRGKVTLTVSKGPAPVPVPNVVNDSVAEATRTLERAGFKVSIRTNVPGGPNVVLQQSPGAGSEQPKGSTISLDVF